MVSICDNCIILLTIREAHLKLVSRTHTQTVTVVLAVAAVVAVVVDGAQKKTLAATAMGSNRSGKQR